VSNRTCIGATDWINFALSLTLCLLAFARTSSAAAGSAPALAAEAPLWQVGPARSTILHIKNSDSNSVKGRIILFSDAGQQLSLVEFVVPPGSERSYSILDVLAKEVPAKEPASGALRLELDQSGEGQHVSAYLVIQDVKSGESFKLPVRAGLNFDNENALVAPWYLPNDETQGSVALFNSATQTISVSCLVVSMGREHVLASIVLAPHESRVLNLRTLVQSGTGVPATETGLLLLRYGGPPHALQPALMLSNPATGLMLVSPFGGEHTKQAPGRATLLLPQVQLASATQDGATQESSYLLLSNTTGVSLAPHVLAHYLGANGKLSRVLLPVPALEPSETRTIDVAVLLHSVSAPSDLSTVALSIQYAGNPGDLSLMAFTQDSILHRSRQYSTIFAPGDVLDTSYWNSVDPHGSPSVQNESREPAQVQPILYYDGSENVGSYRLPPLHLAGSDVQSLGATQSSISDIPDMVGSRIPSGAMTGIAILAPASVSPDHPDNSESVDCRWQCNGSSQSSAEGIDGPALQVHFTQPECPVIPFVSSISPPYGSLGTNYPVTISGGNFSSGDRISIGDGITATIRSLTSSEIQATFNIPLTSNTGEELVSVETSEGLYSNRQESNVGDPTPQITSVTPSTWPAGAVTSITITGTGFGTNPSVTVSGTGISQPTITRANNTTITALVSVAPCAPGQTGVPLMVTSTGFSGNGFYPTYPGQLPDGTYAIAVQPESAPNPQIIFDGQNIADGAAQPVVTGQQISLSINTSNFPSGLTISSQQWGNPPGTAVENYEASTNGGGQVIPLSPPFTNSSFTFYWADSSQSNRAITYSYTLCNGVPGAQETATFNVSGPTNPSVSVQEGDVGLTNNNGVLEMVLSGLPYGGGLTGMIFTASANDLPSGGEFVWVQTLGGDAFTLLSQTHGLQQCTDLASNSPLPDLDTQYPYNGTGGTNNNTARDQPLIQLISPYVSVSRAFSATMYLMWNPDLPSSIPVPLGFITWEFSGNAINTLFPQGVNPSSPTWGIACYQDGRNGCQGTFIPSLTWPTWDTASVTGPLHCP
jgi:hypothetical protein